MKLIYISGKYTADTLEGITENITKARNMAIQLWDNGFAALCPHLNTTNFEIDCKAKYHQYIEGDLIMIEGCDGILMLEGWEQSKGAVTEKEHAERLNIPIYYKIEEIL